MVTVSVLSLKAIQIAIYFETFILSTTIALLLRNAIPLCLLIDKIVLTTLVIVPLQYCVI